MALKPKLSKRKLDDLESGIFKFPFLKSQYDGSMTNRMVYFTSFTVIGLCNGNKKLIQKYVTPWRIFDSKLSEKTYRCLDSIETKTICQDAAFLARETVKEFLKELHETGTIMTTTELIIRNILYITISEIDNTNNKFETFADNDHNETSLINQNDK